MALGSDSRTEVSIMNVRTPVDLEVGVCVFLLFTASTFSSFFAAVALEFEVSGN
jgi:hypothetical protein